MIRDNEHMRRLFDNSKRTRRKLQGEQNVQPQRPENTFSSGECFFDAIEHRRIEFRKIELALTKANAPAEGPQLFHILYSGISQHEVTRRTSWVLKPSLVPL